MDQTAHVASIEALVEFKANLSQFGTDANDALTSVAVMLHRVYDWLQDQEKLWKRTIRDRQEEVVEAKADLVRHQMPNALGRIPDCSEQEDALAEAEERLQDAEDKVVLIRRWGTLLLPQAETEYDGPAKLLANFVQGELPRALALLERKLQILSEYVAMSAPSSSADVGPAPATPVAGTEEKPKT